MGERGNQNDKAHPEVFVTATKKGDDIVLENKRNGTSEEIARAPAGAEFQLDAKMLKDRNGKAEITVSFGGEVVGFYKSDEFEFGYGQKTSRDMRFGAYDHGDSDTVMSLANPVTWKSSFAS
ncbi:hypothetical protein [Actibacterium sp. 188UL27-1]|uniref:hypothetical protein n=1 Tax=Actibacterium sp. 188UL27-1 TaxID=2786961 RepID=UPI001956E283|nr:hypothetical protein [Actibacterium sp. 188UL27-1]MBM7069337.1 hypothetical protein [Actibacterium sp. 188UL27-1]